MNCQFQCIFNTINSVFILGKPPNTKTDVYYKFDTNHVFFILKPLTLYLIEGFKCGTTTKSNSSSNVDKADKTKEYCLLRSIFSGWFNFLGE